MEFSWWVRDADQGKFQVRAVLHGGRIAWARQPARFASWEEYAPGDDDWDRLLADAERRVPRRLLSPKEFERIRDLRAQAAG